MKESDEYEQGPVVPIKELADDIAEEYRKEGVRANVQVRIQIKGERHEWIVYLHREDYKRYVARIKDDRMRILETHGMPFGGVNQQSQGLAPPAEDEVRLELYIIDLETQAIKNFKVTNAIKMLLERKAGWISYGSTHMGTAQQVKVVLAWRKP